MTKPHFDQIDTDKLKSNVDILDIVGNYVSLKKYGKVYKSLCPFHDEKTPSFTIYRQTQSFYCFGCGVGGDIIKFIELIENLSFIEAAARLGGGNYFRSDSNKTGMQRPMPVARQPRTEPDPRMIDLYTKAYEISRQVILNAGGHESDNVRAYLASRGFTPADITRTHIGSYVPEVREFLTDKCDKDLLGKSGLISYGMSYNYQIVMPHYNKGGNIIGLTARIVKEGTDKEGRAFKKYKHSPDLDKSYCFNLYQAQKSIATQQCVIIVEGHLDVQSLLSNGFTNCVCVGGNHLNSEHIDNLAGAGARTFIIWFDSDERGLHGCSEAIKSVLFDGRVNVFVVTSNKYKDVGEINVIGDKRSDAIIKLVTHAANGAYWLGKYLVPRDNEQERQQALLEAKDIYLRIKNPISQRDFLKGLAAGAGVKTADVEKSYRGSANSDNKPRSARKDSLLEVVFELDDLIRKDTGLTDVRKYLEDYYAMNRKKVKPSVNTAVLHMRRMCLNYDFASLKEFIQNNLSSS